MDIKTGRPGIADRKEIEALLQSTINHTFLKEGIHDPLGKESTKEINTLKKSLDLDFDTNGETEYYLMATLNEKIVGVIAYGQPNNIIISNIKPFVEGTPEVKSVYILPEYQNNGIGSLLFKEIIKALHTKNVNFFFLDCGYKSSQLFWEKKLGQPNITLENYWGAGNHHKIWYRKIKDILI